MVNVILLTLLAATGPKTAVFELEATGRVDPELAKSASLVLPTEVRKHAKGAVISGDEIRSMIGLERQKALLGCGEDSSCLAEISGALGVDELVSGNLGRVGKTLVLELHRVDTHKARTLSSATRTIEGDPDELLGAVRGAVSELYGSKSADEVATGVGTSVERSPLALPLTVGGGALVVGGAVGAIWALSVKGAIDQQQNPDVAPTVSVGTASTAQTIFPISIVAAIAGAAAAGYGATLLLGGEDQPAEVSFIPTHGGAIVGIGASF
ncbi:MAG: hypothetical protein ACJ790_03810 [Myxococcaceae bacterium]